MAKGTEKFAYRVELDGKTAGESLEILKKKSVELREQMKKLKEANDLAGFEQVERQAKSVAREMKRYEVAVFDVQKVMNNLSGVMRRDLLTAQKALQRQLNDELTPGTKEYEAALKSLGLVQKQIITLTKQQRAAGKDTGGENKGTGMFSKIAEGVNKYALAVGGAIVGISSLADKAELAVDAFNKFEQSKAQLQSLTGVTKEARDEMGEFALELSTSVVEGGVRITKTATDIVDGFKLVGSQLPVLLKDSEALQQVTKDALILSEASGGPVEQNVRGLTTTMNQFNLVTSDTNETIKQSHRVINILAAGAQAGAGEIPYIQEAMEKAGTQANMFGISVENTVGIIETLAPRISEASTAGIALKGVFLDLEKQGNDKFKPSVVGYAKAMDNLAAANLNVNDLLKLFKTEHFTAAKTLIDHRDETVKYTAAVTDSNKAIEQATINTDTNTAKIAQAKNVAEKYRIELGEKLSPILLALTVTGTKLLGVINWTIDLFTINTDRTKDLTAAFEKHKTVVNGLTENIEPLLKRYEALKGETNLTAVEQEELKGIIEKISTAIPTAIKEFDKYGKAMSINTEAAKKYIEQQKKLLEYENRIAIAQNEAQLKQTRSSMTGLQATLNKKSKEVMYGSQGMTKQVELTAEDVIELQAKLGFLALEESALQTKINNLKGVTINDVAVEGTEKDTVTITGETDEERKARLAREAAALKSYLEKQEQEVQKSIDRLKDINRQLFIFKQDEITKELIAVSNKYQDEINLANANAKKYPAQAKVFNQQVLAATEKLKQEQATIVKKYDDAEAKQKQDDLTKRKEERDRLMHFLVDEKAEELALYKKLLEDHYITKEQYLQAEAMLNEKYRKKDIKETKKVEKTKQEIMEERLALEMRVASALSGFLQSQMELELQQAGTNEEKKKQITKKYADIELAITEAKIIATTALAVMSALAMVPPNPFLAVAAGVTGAFEAATAVNQRNRIRGFEHGLYNVTRTDGMQYRAGVSSDTSTQMVSKPTVFMAGEGNTGIPEMIIDAGTLRRMQINYPDAIDAIHRSRSGGGGVSAGVSSSTSSHKEIIREVADAKTIEVMEELNGTLKKGIVATIVYRDFKNFTDKVDASQNDFN